MGSCHVTQAGLKLLGLSYPPASASQSAGITGMSHHSCPSWTLKEEKTLVHPLTAITTITRYIYIYFHILTKFNIPVCHSDTSKNWIPQYLNNIYESGISDLHGNMQKPNYWHAIKKKERMKERCQQVHSWTFIPEKWKLMSEQKPGCLDVTVQWGCFW